MESDLPSLICELTDLTGRGENERIPRQRSLSALARTLAHCSLAVHVHFERCIHTVALGYQLPGASSCCDVVLLGRHKRDFLAYPPHVERWRRSHLERAAELAERCNAANLLHDAERRSAVAWWAYEQGQAAGAHVWIRGDELVRLEGGWRDALRDMPPSRVAEPPSRRLEPRDYDRP